MSRLGAAAVVLFALVATASADVRIDGDDGPRRDPAWRPTRPGPPPPRGEDKGCSSKSDMAPEWVFGLAAIGFGAYFLRRKPAAT